jgi:hypothetical protein
MVDIEFLPGFWNLFLPVKILGLFNSVGVETMHALSLPCPVIPLSISLFQNELKSKTSK